MGIFDNATSITIDNKEVKSIKVGTATIYEKDEEEVGSTITFTLTGKNNSTILDPVPFSGVTITLTKDETTLTSTVSDSDGVCTVSNVPDGTYTVNATKGNSSLVFIVDGINHPTVDKDIDSTHNSFELLLWKPSE